jgi:hypothetical protein
VTRLSSLSLRFRGRVSVSVGVNFSSFLLILIVRAGYSNWFRSCQEFLGVVRSV